MQVGQKYRFKRLKKQPGNMTVGTVVRRAGALTYFEKNDGTVVPIQTRHIRYYYVFQPYNKKVA